jgi:4-hydroxyacetophenone monooxygenase
MPFINCFSIDWPQMFSRREDILQYLETVSRKYDMAKHTYFETKVTSAVWIEKIKKWKLEFKNATLEERVLYFDLVFSAMGTLSVPNIPSELKNFTGGPIIHTYNWDSSIEYKGKRIALVGSGAR